VKRVAILALSTLLLSGAATAADRRVTVVNATANTMTRLYVSPAQGAPIEEDMLGDTVLRPGRSAQLDIAGGGDACVFTFKASFDNDTTRTARVDVCEVRTYRFTGE
jgi:PBP1b-binding outer membrane lipoprotein LpoB